ncbi:uncharacterized protein LOC120844777, partial [Ixodes scapularis]|uniref:uncharacterized protein LOC120844777 n=1 Tax=Ixodes scapularis TaxID=6945 RepID=UPI001A9CCD6C
TGEAMKCSLVLHADTRGRPYRAEDFVGPLNQVGVREDVAGLGAFQMGHVWLLKLHTASAKEKLLREGTILVKARPCLVIDPEKRELKVKVHWVAFDVTADALRRAFETYGEVKGVTREKWRIEGLADVDSTTVIVRMVLREGVTPESLPHQLRLYGGPLLVVVPGRAPVCLRCRRTGHVRRDCRVPRCEECRAFGHVASDCVRSYARAAASKTTESQDRNLVMDEEEAEAAATPTARISSQDRQESGEQEHELTAMPKGQVSTVTLTAEGSVCENESNAKKTSETTPAAKDTTDALDAGDGTAMDFATEAIERRLSDPEQGTDQTLQQTEGPWFIVTSKRGRRAGPSRSSSLPR